MTTTAYLPTRQFSKTLFFSPCNHRKQQSVCRGRRSLRNVSLHSCYVSTLWVLCTLDVKPFRLPITCWLLFIKGRMAWKITDRASQLALLSWMSSNEACCQVISPPPPPKTQNRYPRLPARRSSHEQACSRCLQRFFHDIESKTWKSDCYTHKVLFFL